MHMAFLIKIVMSILWLFWIKRARVTATER